MVDANFGADLTLMYLQRSTTMATFSGKSCSLVEPYVMCVVTSLYITYYFTLHYDNTPMQFAASL